MIFFPRTSHSFFVQATIAYACIWMASAQTFDLKPQFIQSREPIGERSSRFTFERNPKAMNQLRIMSFTDNLYPVDWNGDKTANSSIGIVQGVCFETLYDRYYECFHTLELPGGSMTAHGPYNVANTFTTQVITGASGIYANYRGEARYVPNANGTILWRFKLWTFNTSTIVLPRTRPRTRFISLRSRPGGRSSGAYNYLPIPTEAQPQRMLLHHSQLRGANNTRAGYVQAVCIESYYNNYFECLFTMAMSSKDVITIQGPLDVTYSPTSLAVTGTRGMWQKYRGLLKLMPEDIDLRTAWDFRLLQVLA